MSMIIGVLLMLISGMASQPPPPPSAFAPAVFDLSGYRSRLTALDPADPLAYLEFAEEVAAEERSPEGRLLARRLYVLALLGPVHRGAAAPPPGSERRPAWLASSACLGLATLADHEQDRRWLAALAGTLAPGDLAPAVQQQAEVSRRDPSALELATALGLVRSGDGRRAARVLDKPGVAALLARYEGLMNPGGLGGGGERVRNLAYKFPVCPECHNRRSVRTVEGVRLCPTCHGRPGPNLTIEETVGQLRLESMLLSGVQRSWAAQAVADGGAPMRELDPEVLVDVYGVDPEAVYWREGAWMRSPSGPDLPSPDPAPSAPAPAHAAPPTPPA